MLYSSAKELLRNLLSISEVSHTSKYDSIFSVTSSGGGGGVGIMKGRIMTDDEMIMATTSSASTLRSLSEVKTYQDQVIV